MKLRKFFVGRSLGFLVLVVIFFVYGFFYKFNTTNLKLCYIRNTEDGASSNLVLNLVGKKVSGYYKLVSSEKDIKEGPITGKVFDADTELSNGIIDLKWKASSLGVTNTEELKLRFSEGVVAPGFGPMRKEGNVYVYSDPDKLVFEPNLSFVDCETEIVN